MFALIEAASIVFIEGRQVMVIEVPPVLLDYLAVFGADDAEFEIDDWSEDDDPLEDDDPNGPSDLEYGD